METSKLQQLQQAGIDTQEALGRFMGNEALMLKFLLRFPQDPNHAKLLQAMEAGDASAAYAAAHTLKGVAGSLSIKPLFDQASAITEDLRSGHLTAAAEKLPALIQTYQSVLQAINAL